ncbi:MAG: hypothetical protein EOO67_11755 [Microbacterium sp.]|nr:MAG: hypothetical protein EOO67_11755 [Microbacterium sp.]
MARPPDPPPPASSPRAQLLATEHWGLLAARSTAQSEVLTRITIFLTLFSAGLVSIALLGQATGFDGMFGAFAISVLVVVVVIGQLTQVRVMNVGIEDLGYVLAMNRMRAAYVELDPGIEPYLMASAHDDQAGSVRTYDFFGTRSMASHLMGSSMVLILVVNAILLGLLTSAIALTAGAPGWLTVTLGAVVAIVASITGSMLGQRLYMKQWRTYRAIRPTPTVSSEPAPGPAAPEPRA